MRARDGTDEGEMHSLFSRLAGCSVLCAVLLLAAATAHPQAAPPQGGDFSQNPQAKPLPTGTLLVKGAWASSSDATTPVPEGGVIANGVYNNAYFRLKYVLAPNWIQKYSGPPPSDTGYYVLAQIRPEDSNKSTHGTLLIAAQDLFFALTPAANALEIVNFTKQRLEADYQIERQPSPVNVAGRVFIRFDYFSPVAGLHWYVFATEIRCHMVEFVLTSRDTKLLEGLIEDIGKMELPAEASPILGTGGGDVPVCINGYARAENVLERVDPSFTERRFNPIPVRVIIDKDGKVKHIHFLSAFPDQAKSITDALFQWRFKPYLRDGHPTEVETGIMLGQAPHQMLAPAAGAAEE